MKRAVAQGHVVLAPADALRLWTDTRRWATFVEGFGHVEERSPGWPGEGERVVWQSGPKGRGRVTEKVVAHGPESFATMVFTEALIGRRTFWALPADAGSEVHLALEYTLTKWGPFGGIADALFVRRQQTEALERTLARFAVEAEEEAGLR